MLRSPRRADALVCFGVGALTLAVYVYSLLPGVGYAGDTAKWQFLGVVDGVPHATGYPFYIALDQAWVSTVPWGSVAWRVNLLSAVLGAIAVVLTYLLLRILDVRPAPAAAAALVFALTKTFWSQAVVAEVYTLHLVFLGAVMTCLAHWRLGASNRWLLAGLGLYALSFGHHLSTVVALPGIAWLVWSDRRRALTWRNAAVVVGAALLSACQYLYLMHLSEVGVYHEGRIDSFGDVLEYASGGDFKGSMLGFSWHEVLVKRVPLLLDFARQEFLLLLVPIVVGLWSGLWARSSARRDVAVSLFCLAAGTSLFVMNYDVGDLVVFCIPLFFSLAVFLGLGLDASYAWLRSRAPGAAWIPWALTGGLAAVVMLTGLGNYSKASQRGNVADGARIERALDAVDDSSVLLTSDYHDSEYIWYFLLGEDLGDTRDLALANQVHPGDVLRYLTDRSGPVAVAARRVTGRADPPLYTATPSQATALEEAGLTITPIAEDVWRVSL